MINYYYNWDVLPKLRVSSFLLML